MFTNNQIPNISELSAAEIDVVAAAIGPALAAAYAGLFLASWVAGWQVTGDIVHH